MGISNIDCIQFSSVNMQSEPGSDPNYHFGLVMEAGQHDFDCKFGICAELEVGKGSSRCARVFVADMQAATQFCGLVGPKTRSKCVCCTENTQAHPEIPYPCHILRRFQTYN